MESQDAAGRRILIPDVRIVRTKTGGRNGRNGRNERNVVSIQKSDATPVSSGRQGGGRWPARGAMIVKDPTDRWGAGREVARRD